MKVKVPTNAVNPSFDDVTYVPLRYLLGFRPWNADITNREFKSSLKEWKNRRKYARHRASYREHNAYVPTQPNQEATWFFGVGVDF